MTSIAHPNGSYAPLYAQVDEIKILEYNEDGSYTCVDAYGNMERHVRKTVLVQEDARTEG